MTHIFLHHFFSPLWFDEHMGVSLNGGTQQPWFFLLKMIILGCFGGTTILGNTHIFSKITLFLGDLRSTCPKAQARSAGGPPALEQVGSHCPAAG